MARTRKTTIVLGSSTDIGDYKNCKTEQEKIAWLDLNDKLEKRFYLRGHWKEESIIKFLDSRELHYRRSFFHTQI